MQAEALKLDLKKTQDTLDAAESLLGKLDGERSRWRYRNAPQKRFLLTVPACPSFVLAVHRLKQEAFLPAA